MSFPPAGLDAPEEVADKETAGRYGEGRGHIGHGPLARPDPRLPHDLKAVGDGLYARISPCAHGVGPEHEGEDPEHAYGAEVVAEIAVNALP